MLSRNGLSISLVRIDNDEQLIPFPRLEREELDSDPRSRNTLEHLSVSDGEIFAIRIAISSNFEWFESDVLLLTINYDKTNGENAAFKFPWIAKPVKKGDSEVIVETCPIWNQAILSWVGHNTQFWDEEVMP